MTWGILPIAVLALLEARLPAQSPTIPSTYSLPSSAADASKPGFIWRIHHVTSSQPNSNARTESQLAGELGPNMADPNISGAATGPAAAPSPDTAPISFEIPTVINLDRSGGSYGNFTPDDQMPGLPGTDSGTDNDAGEVLTWLDLPAGEITMGVNSDDGFRMSIGGPIPSDRLTAVTVGEYEGGRGAGDTIFKFKIEKAGLYAARVIWENGTGDANLEWFSVKEDGTTKVLVNDTANGGYKAYRAVSGISKTYLSKANPTPNASGVSPITPIQIELQEGASALDLASIKLTLDGSPVVATPTRSGKVITISYQPATPFARGSTHSVSLAFTDGGAVVTLPWSFSVANFATLPSVFKVTPDTSKPGFIWNVFINGAVTTASNARAENALAGRLVDTDGNAYPNLADPTAKGAALAASTAPSPDNAPIKFEIATVINLSQSASDAAENQNGNFKPDQQMPGIPAQDGGNDGIAAEVLTYLELPAGIITMGVNSDEGFRITAGMPQDVFNSILLGEFDGARIASDTLFTFVAQEAGVYPFRLLYQEGTGPASVEWFTVKADGTKVLVGDSANGGVKAYRASTTPLPPYVKSVSPQAVPRQLPNPHSTSLVIQLSDGTNPVDDNSIVLKLDGQTLSPSKNRQGQIVTVTYTPTTLQVPDEQHTAELAFKDSTGTVTRNQTWKFYNLINVVLPTAAILENFDSYDEGSVPTGWVATNFTTTGTAGENLDDLNSDSYKGWIVVSRSRLEGLKSRIFNVASNQFVNGQPVTSLSDGNLLYAESDVRGGNQVQFIVTKPYDLSKITNVVLSFSSLYEQNQDSLGAVEYSVDGGKTWMPVVYYLDYVDGGGDIKLNADGSVDAVKTMTGANTDTANWTENGVDKGDKYGDGILAPITQALGPYIAPRANDDNTIDKRVEVYRLPQAGQKSDVRLRFAQLGTGSWYFGVDNLGFYEGPPPATTPVTQQAKFNPPTFSGGNCTISWTGAGTLEEASSVTGPWTSSANQANPQTMPVSGAKYFRIRQ